MNEFGFNLVSQFSPVWGVFVYITRGIFEYFIGKNWVDKKEYIKDKLALIGTDIYWISFVIWGIVLTKSEPDNKFVSDFGNDFHIRLISFGVLVLIGVVVTGVKSKERKMRDKSLDQISTFKDDIPIILLNLCLLIVGIVSFWSCFVYLSDIKP